MKRVTFAILASLLMLVPLQASDWAPVAKSLVKSIVYIESKQGSCTGFVSDNERDYVVTAAHCDGTELMVDGMPSKVVHKDTKKDLLVLEVKGLDRPALRLAKENPKVGEQVASYGYGWGLERPMFRTAVVSDDDTYIPEEGIGGPFITIDAEFVPGQSGGPVVDLNGDVALIVQRGGGGVGIGVGAEVIRSKVGRYFGSKAPKP